jgi:hypothetical protein
VSRLDACPRPLRRVPWRLEGGKVLEQTDELGEGEGAFDAGLPVHDGRLHVDPFEGDDQIERVEFGARQTSAAMTGEIDPERLRELHRLGKRLRRVEVEDAEGGALHRKPIGLDGEQRCGERAPKPVAGADEGDVEGGTCHA